MPTKKVAVEKAVVKKAPVKKVATKRVSAKKELVYADNTTSFWVSDGQVLNSLVALKDALSSMEKTVFAHHVTKDKNDFAQWVGRVLCDEACAADLMSAKTPTTAKAVVVRHLKVYSI